MYIHTETHACTQVPTSTPPAPLWLGEGQSGLGCLFPGSEEGPSAMDGTGLLHF